MGKRLSYLLISSLAAKSQCSQPWVSFCSAMSSVNSDSDWLGWSIGTEPWLSLSAPGSMGADTTSTGNPGASATLVPGTPKGPPGLSSVCHSSCFSWPIQVPLGKLFCFSESVLKVPTDQAGLVPWLWRPEPKTQMWAAWVPCEDGDGGSAPVLTLRVWTVAFSL
jgi:hypothetical protein